MFIGLKNQLELSDSLIENILPQDNELVKLKKILNWKEINKVYKSCFSSKTGNRTKTTDIALGLILLKHKEIGKKIIRQTQKKLKDLKVADRIVSYYEPHAKALPKGK